jgi:hypothetical protein
VQQPRALAVGGGWQHFQQHQQAQLCLLLEQQQSLHYQQLQQDASWDPLQYVLQQQAPQQQPLSAPSSRGRGVAVVAAAAAAASASARQQRNSSTATAAADGTSTAGWPAATFDSITDVVDLQHALVQWPQDKQPKLGCITKNKLRKLTVGHSLTVCAN